MRTSPTRTLATVTAVTASAALLLAGPAAAARVGGGDQGGAPLDATLTGDAEVPPGDPDGSGEALVSVNRGQQTVCFELEARGIAPATDAHIHRGAAGVAGPVVIGLAPPTGGSASGCVEDVEPGLLEELLETPEAFYVNVHNAEFPPGAVRGQLTRPGR